MMGGGAKKDKKFINKIFKQIKEGGKVLNIVEKHYDIKFNFQEFPWSSEYYFSHGEMMPENGERELSDFNAICISIY